MNIFFLYELNITLHENSKKFNQGILRPMKSNSLKQYVYLDEKIKYVHPLNSKTEYNI